MKVCPVCGAAVDDAAEYCDNCGNDEFYDQPQQFQQYDDYNDQYNNGYAQPQYPQNDYNYQQPQYPQNDYNQYPQQPQYPQNNYNQYQQQLQYPQNNYNQYQQQPQYPQNDYNQYQQPQYPQNNYNQYQQPQYPQNNYNQYQQPQYPQQNSYPQEQQYQQYEQQPVVQEQPVYEQQQPAVQEQPVYEQQQPAVQEQPVYEQQQPAVEETAEPVNVPEEMPAEETEVPAEVQETEQTEEIPEQPEEPEEPKENPYEVSKNFVFEKSEKSENEEQQNKEMPKNVKGFIHMFMNTKDHTYEFDKDDIAKNQKNALIACFGLTFWFPFTLRDYSRYARFYGNQGLLTLITMIPSIIFYSLIMGVVVCNACTASVYNNGVEAFKYLTFGGWIAAIVFFAICFAIPIFIIYCSFTSIKQGKAKDIPFIGRLRLIS